MNCVRPGFVNTPIVDTVPDHLKAMLLAVTPMQRMGEPHGRLHVQNLIMNAYLSQHEHKQHCHRSIIISKDCLFSLF